jgi:hypothetical protein
MGRNRGFTAALIQIQREADRQARARAAAETRAAREAERAHRAYDAPWPPRPRSANACMSSPASPTSTFATRSWLTTLRRQGRGAAGRRTPANHRDQPWTTIAISQTWSFCPVTPPAVTRVSQTVLDGRHA